MLVTRMVGDESTAKSKKDRKMQASETLVTGGTGSLGRLVVARLRDAGRDVRVLGRRRRPGTIPGDLLTGEGLEQALEGAGVPRLVPASGLTCALWHVPLVLAGVYAAGPSLARSTAFIMVSITSFGYVVVRVRLETGSVWRAMDDSS